MAVTCTLLGRLKWLSGSITEQPGDFRFARHGGGLEESSTVISRSRSSSDDAPNDGNGDDGNGNGKAVERGLA